MDSELDDQHAEGEEENDGTDDGEGEEEGEEEGEDEGEEEEEDENGEGESRVVEMEGVETERVMDEIPASQPDHPLYESTPPLMLPDSQPIFEESQPALDDMDIEDHECCSKILPHGTLTCLTADFLETQDWCQNCLKRLEAAPKSPEQHSQVITVEETPEKAVSLEEREKMIKSLERKLSAATSDLANARKVNTAQILFSILSASFHSLPEYVGF